jgi:hypothetical protein
MAEPVRNILVIPSYVFGLFIRTPTVLYSWRYRLCQVWLVIPSRSGSDASNMLTGTSCVTDMAVVIVNKAVL